MPGFGFSEAQEMYRREVRQFAQKELAPAARQRAKNDFVPVDILKKLASFGFTGMSLPSEYGGQPIDWVSQGIVIEELARVDLGASTISGISGGVAAFLLKGGSEEMKREWLPQFARGEKVACLAVTEPDAGSDAASLKTKAIREGDYYIIEGEKGPITMGMQADVAMVFAKTDPEAGARGVTCFMVPVDLPGVKRSKMNHTGWKPTGAASWTFDRVKLPAKYRMGAEGKGFYIVMNEFDIYRIILSLSAMGMAQASLEEAIRYAQQRQAFGQQLSAFEGVSFKIAHHATLIEAGRMLCYRTLWLKDQGQKHTKESSMAKLICPQIALNAIHDCLLIHGHIGYSTEAPYEQRMRDTIGFEIADGTAEIMKTVLVREILGAEFLPY